MVAATPIIQVERLFRNHGGDSILSTVAWFLATSLNFMDAVIKAQGMSGPDIDYDKLK
jgi:hypothetical protein